MTTMTMTAAAAAAARSAAMNVSIPTPVQSGPPPSHPSGAIAARVGSL
jgi:hypothetical protein